VNVPFKNEPSTLFSYYETVIFSTVTSIKRPDFSAGSTSGCVELAQASRRPHLTRPRDPAKLSGPIDGLSRSRLSSRSSS
jgi:hypothetical protein